jgi:hypothetical protein
LSDQYTNAEEMARSAGLPNGKAFRARLRKRHPDLHVQGSWRTVIGSEKHRAMQRELDELVGESARPT